MLRCLVLFVLDCLPFASKWMLLVLSCCSTDGCAPSFLITDSIGRFSTCCSMNNFIYPHHEIHHVIHSNDFCYCRARWINLLFGRHRNTAPFPNVNIESVWLIMSLCTANEASILHSKVPESSRPITSGRYTVAWRYQITLASFRKLSSLGSLTLIHRYATATCISGRARFAAYSNLFVIQWKNSAYS